MTGSYDFILSEGDDLDPRLTVLPAGDATTVVRGGTLLDGKGNRLNGGTVVIEGTRIAAVQQGPVAEAIPPAARVIDATGMSVMPGMIDAHLHFNGEEMADRYRSYFTPPEGVKLVRAAFEMYQVLASGFTTVRVLGHGHAEHPYALRQAKLEGLIRGPRVITSGWALSQTRGHGDAPQLPYDWVEQHRPRAVFCDGIDECRVMVRRNFGEGADLAKVFTSDNRTGRPDFTVEELKVVVEEAHRRGRKVATHAKTYEGVRNALLAGIDTIEHGPPKAYPNLLQMMVDHGAFLVPTLVTVYRVGYEGSDWGVPPATMDRAKRELEGRMEAVRAAHEAGVKIAVGSDAGARAGFGLLSARELALLVQCGLTPMEAISAATGVAAEALGLDAHIGTLVAGKLGELLVIAGDPLADIELFQDRRNLRSILQVQDPLTF